MKDAFAHFWVLRAACPQISSPIIDENDNLVSDKEGKSACWKTYYQQLLNKPPATPTKDLISAAASAEEDPDINCDKPTWAEVAVGKGPRNLWYDSRDVESWGNRQCGMANHGVSEGMEIRSHWTGRGE